MGKQSASRVAKCPKCGGRRVAPLLWGVPVFSRRLERELRSARVRIDGGGGGGPDLRCNACGHEWRE